MTDQNEVYRIQVKDTNIKSDKILRSTLTFEEARYWACRIDQLDKNYQPNIITYSG